MTLKLSNIGQLATYNSRLDRVERLENVEMILEGTKIASIGKSLPSAHDEIDVSGCLVTPGFVDAHTHPVFAETREHEFEMRALGKSYKDIAAAGGGIISSVRTLKALDEGELSRRVEGRMWDFLRLGTTTLEAKSGYGLSTESELKSLRVLKRVSESVPVDIVPTFLGAHDFPLEYSDNRSAYVDLVCQEMIPAVADQGIAEFCDVFCEKGWFSLDDSRRILTVGVEYGLKPRLHADEFEDSGAASLAAEMNASSADHLMCVSHDAIALMARHGVVATLLPGTTFFLGRTRYAPARKFLDAGVEVALASDFNPGSSMIQSMGFVLSLACLYLGMSVDEALRAATYGAAKSVGREKVIGSLEPGKQADLIVWTVRNLAEVPYHVDGNRLYRIIKKGVQVAGQPSPGREN
ncbi:MAG: imidazolonepropionase [Candidatus Neomarinimicrobiota bacterium]